MATQFSIDDAFVLEGEEEGTVSDAEADGWKNRDNDREGEMTFGTLSFSKPQTHQSPAATGSVEHSNLKYQVSSTALIDIPFHFRQKLSHPLLILQNLENEDALGSNGNSSFNNIFKIKWVQSIFCHCHFAPTPSSNYNIRFGAIFSAATLPLCLTVAPSGPSAPSALSHSFLHSVVGMYAQKYISKHGKEIQWLKNKYTSEGGCHIH